MSRKLIIALEQEEIIANAVVAARPIVAVIPNAAESPETAMLEVQENTISLNERVEMIDTAVETADDLEELSEVVEEAEQQGGLSVESLQILEIALKQCYRRAGMDYQKPAMESHTEQSKVQAAHTAMESINEGVNKVWQNIIEAFNRMIQWSTEFFAKIFGAWEKQSTRALKLKELVHSMDGKTPQNKTVNNKGIANGLAVSGKVPTAGQFDQELGWFFSMGSTIFRGLDYDINKKKVGHLLNNQPTAEELISKLFIQRGSEAWPKFKDVTGKDGFPEPSDERLGVYRSDEFFGGMAMIAIHPKNDAKGQEAAELIAATTGKSLTLGKFHPNASFDVPDVLPTLDIRNMSQLCQGVEFLAKDGIAYRRLEQEINNIRKKLVETAKKYSEKEPDNKVARDLIVATSRNFQQLTTEFAPYGLRTVKHLLDYVEMSLKQYA